MVTNNAANNKTGALNTILQGKGVGTASDFSTATYPATTTANRVLYSSATNTVTDLATQNSGLFITNSSGVPSVLATGYITGTWTPAVSSTGTPPSVITYGVQRGNYTRIGNIVFVECLVSLASYTAGTGTATVTGLPYTVGGGLTFPCAAFSAYQITFTGTYLVGQFQGSTTTLQISQCTTASNSSQLAAAALSASSIITFSGFYQV